MFTASDELTFFPGVKQSTLATSSRVMSVGAQHHVMRAVKPFSTELANAVKAIGLVTVETRTRESLGYFLSRSVIGPTAFETCLSKYLGAHRSRRRKALEINPRLLPPAIGTSSPPMRCVREQDQSLAEYSGRGP